jgi:hypothetical protein
MAAGSTGNGGRSDRQLLPVEPAMAAARIKEGRKERRKADAAWAFG